ncbi:MAG: DUF5702 domain-containing protein [Clostridiales Family XIII bacterium]|jgi:hypothetical protein|nr:DUF5702 domain-containing protein [Clostridiales Family XIII bacterium]
MAYGKRGSTSVFLTLVFASLIIVSSVLIRAAGLSAGRSYGDAVFNMAGRSLLAEYDKKLFEDYGIFGMRTDEEIARRKLLHYSDASLEKGIRMDGTLWVLPCGVSDLTTDLNEFSLLDIDVFEEQILGDVKNVIVNNVADRALGRDGADESGGGTGGGGTGGGEAGAGGGAGDRAGGGVVGRLENQTIINALPSRGVSGSEIPIQTLIDNGLPSVSELMDGGADIFLTTEYLLARFAHANEAVPELAADHSRFFANEVEYIVAGKHSDKENYSSVKIKLALLRFLMNEIYLHSDNERMDVVRGIEATLSALVPPPWPQILRELIIAAWVTVESDNDMNMLADGGQVPLFKSSENWACDADGIAGKVLAHINAIGRVGGGEEEEEEPRYVAPVKPEKEEGFHYVDYLRLFLYFVPRDVKLLRTMDLIQLNLKSSYYESFLIRDYYTGIRYSLMMNGDRFTYVQRYAKQTNSEDGNK